MSGIWGKLVGGVAGFALGGPLGALLGTAAGHFVDLKREDDDGPPPRGPADLTASRQAAFAVAMIVLSAKMAKADGRVTRDEISAFKDIFKIPPGDMKGVGRLFDQAKKTAEGYEPYARQVAKLFAGNPAVLEELLGGLFHIARADGVIHPGEIEFLRGVSAIFGFADRDFERIREVHAGSMPGGVPEPYTVLGVTPASTDEEIKKAYRTLVRENHPDTLIAQGLPQDFIDLAHEKMAAINGAYDQIRKQRGF